MARDEARRPIDHVGEAIAVVVELVVQVIVLDVEPIGVELGGPDVVERRQVARLGVRGPRPGK